MLVEMGVKFDEGMEIVAGHNLIPRRFFGIRCQAVILKCVGGHNESCGNLFLAMGTGIQGVNAAGVRRRRLVYAFLIADFLNACKFRQPCTSATQLGMLQD